MEHFKNIYYTIKRFFRNLKRSIAFAIIGWNNYDWDYGYLYELILFKLERMQSELINGIAEHDKATLQSLRICIKLLKKLKFRDYTHFTDLHYSKWGQPELVFHKIKKDGIANPHVGSILELKYEKAITEEQKEQQKKEFLEAYRKDNEQEMRDIRLLFDIMKKYNKAWWG